MPHNQNLHINMKHMMKKFLLLFVLLMVQSTAWAQNESVVPQLELWEFDDFTVRLPEGCVYSEELSLPDIGQNAMINPDKSFIFFYCYFQVDEDFTPEDRLISEAAQMGMEITGDDDMMKMKISDSAYLCFSGNNKMAVGITRLHPDDDYGICYFVMTPHAEEDSYFSILTLTSIRSKE